MRVLLIAPPVNSFTGLIKRGYPLGLCMLAAIAKQEKVESVFVYDADKCYSITHGLNFTDQRQNMAAFIHGVNNPEHPVWHHMRLTLLELNPQLVGITTMTADYASALKVAQMVKEWNSDCTVIMGGAHASVMPKIMIEWPYTDAVVKGEGEEPFRAILRRLGTGSTNFEDLTGVITKESIKKADETPLEVEDLDALPFPDRSALLSPEKYSSEDMGLMLTSRGCPFRCSYCSNFSKLTRFRSTDHVLEEIDKVQREFGTFQFMFKDDSFTLSRKRVEGFCVTVARRGFKFLWESTTRLDLIDDRLVEIMKRAGCNRVAVGIESGDDAILKLMNKKLTKDKIRFATSLLTSNGLFWTAYFMMGLPIEDETHLRATLEFMKELQPPYAAIGIYKPYPGTKLFELAENSGLVSSNVSNEHFLTNNPVDYFLTAPPKRSLYLSADRLDALANFMEKEFDKWNKSFANMARRAFSRRQLYLRHPTSLMIDLTRAAKWFRN
ncbi:MAG: radical SAM protein [Desulfomonile sp.]